MSDDFFDHSIEKDMFYCHTCGKHSEDMDDEEYELHITSKPKPKSTEQTKDGYQEKPDAFDESNDPKDYRGMK